MSVTLLQATVLVGLVVASFIAGLLIGHHLGYWMGRFEELMLRATDELEPEDRPH